MEEDFIPMLELDEETLIEEATEQIDSGEESKQNFKQVKQEEEEEEEEEEYQEEEEEPEEEEEEDEKEAQEDEIAQVQALYKTLTAKSILPEEKDPPKSWEELDEKIDELPSIIAESLVASLPEESQLLIEYVINNPNVTKDSLKQFVTEYLDTLGDSDSNMSEEDAANYLTKKYKSQGLSNKAISIAIETLKDDGELLEEAESELNKDRAVYKKQLEQQTLKEKEMEKQRQIANKAYWNTIAEELNNRTWKNDKKQELYSYLKSNGITDSLKEIYKSPKGLIELADLLKKYDSKSATFDLKIIKEKAESEGIKKVKDVILKDAFNTALRSTSKKKIRSDFENLEPVL